jgi:catechol 2,3-dioxygenase-like lactoylglutathione lyase family enzyme
VKPRLGSVPVYVSDQQRALEFYRDSLGFEVVMDVPLGPDARWLVVAPEPGGPEISIFKPEGGGTFGTQSHVERVGEPTGYIFFTDDMQATYAMLRDRGVSFASEPKQEQWGWQTSFTDPDGNGFLLVQRTM